MRSMLWKSTFREIRQSLGRFVAILAIVALGVGFFAGLKVTKSAMVTTTQKYYEEEGFYDLRLLTTLGLDQEEVELLATQEDVLTVEGAYLYDILCLDSAGDELVIRAHSLMEETNGVELEAGRMPEAADECVVDSSLFDEDAIGTTLRISGENESSDADYFVYEEYTIVGIVRSSYYIQYERGSSSLGTGVVSGFMYLLNEGFDSDYYTEVFVRFDQNYDLYSEEYDAYIEEKEEIFETLMEEIAAGRLFKVQTLYEDKLADARKELEDGRAEGEEELAEAVSELKDASKELTEAEFTLQLAEDEIAAARQTLEEKEEEVLSAEETIAENEQTLADAQEEIEENVALWEEQNETVQEALLELATSQAELDVQQATLDAQLLTLQESEATLAESLEELETAERELDLQEAELISTEQLLNSLSALTEDASGNDSSSIDSILSSLGIGTASDLQTQLEALLGSSSTSSSLSGYTEEEIEAYKAQIAEGRELIATYREQIAAGKEEIAAASAQITAGYAAIAEGQATIDAYQQQIDEATKELTDAQAQLASAWQQILNAKAEVASGHVTLQEAKVELTEGKQQLSDGWKELAEAEEEFAEGMEEYLSGKSEYLDGIRQYLEGYEEFVEEIADAEEEIADAERTLADLEDAVAYVLGRDTNIGYACFESDSGIVDGIANVFPVFFFAVAALVCITTMNRMVEEQRTQIGVLKALGYGTGRIMGKYLFYSGSAAVVGCLIGYFVGTWLFPLVIWTAYGMMYKVSGLVYVFDLTLFVISLAVSCACSVGATWVSCRNELAEVAAELMRPKAPKAGQRVMLERVPFIWNRLKFLYKVSYRNIFRYKKRFLMMLIGISGCSALLVTGFGIKDSIANVAGDQFDKIQVYDISVVYSNAVTQEMEEELTSSVGEEIESYLVVLETTIDMYADDRTKSVNLLAVDEETGLDGFIDLHTADGESVAFPGYGECVVNETLADDYNISVGDTIVLQDDSGASIELNVIGLNQNFIYNYVYISTQSYEDLVGEVQYKSVYINAAEGQDLHLLSASLMKLSSVASVTVNEDTEERFNNMMQSLDLIVLVIILCAGCLAFIVMYNLTNINITERVREIATIKVLGFYRKETASYVFRENIVLTMMGALIGLVLGFFLHRFVMTQIKVDLVNFDVRIKAVSYVYSVALTLVFAWIVDKIMQKKLDAISMTESLKSVD